MSASKILLMSFLIGIVVLMGCILVFFLFIQPDMELAEKQRENDLDKCLSDAIENYHSRWDRTCEANDLGKDCKLTSELANNVEDSYEDAKDECYYRYEVLY